MDARSELARERGVLAVADRHLRQGRARVASQEALLSHLRDAGAETREAERLLALLVGTLDQWRWHRELIQKRISSIEASLACEGRAP